MAQPETTQTPAAMQTDAPPAGPAPVPNPTALPDGTLDLTADGGVLKKLLRPGTGLDHPEDGDDILMHYVGRLTDGTVFDSSRERGEPFKFKLGKGAVIKGWDITTKTMTQNELAEVILLPAYAYGESGSPPKIPANATLNFEMELVGWISHKDLFGDGGVMKSVADEGEGWERPLDLAEVTFHVLATDASEKDNKKVLFDGDRVFTVGSADVPEAWNKIVKDMKKNTRLILECTGKYIAGPGIDFVPATATKVEYDLRLVSWLKVEDVTKDGGVIKKSIIEGEGWEKPNDGSVVTINAVVRVLGPDGAPLEPPAAAFKGEKFKINDGVVMDGMDRAAQAMKKGETALVTIKPQYAFLYCPQLAPAGVKKDDTLLVEMQLETFEKGKETWSMTFEEKAVEMQERKEKGNDLFKQSRVHMAIRNYERAISFFEYSTSELSSELRKKVNVLLVQCHLNMAACYEKLGDTNKIMHHCKKALDIEPSNPKALYRRAGAFMALGEYFHAESDLKHALDGNPDSMDVKRRMKQLAKLMAEQDKKDKKLYNDMFSKYFQLGEESKGQAKANGSAGGAANGTESDGGDKDKMTE